MGGRRRGLTGVKPHSAELSVGSSSREGKVDGRKEIKMGETEEEERGENVHEEEKVWPDLRWKGEFDRELVSTAG